MQEYYAATFLTILSEIGISQQSLRDSAASVEIKNSPGTDATTLAADKNGDSARLVARAMEMSGDYQLGLRLGSRLSLSAQGIFGYALMSSNTVADALKLLVRYNKVILPNMSIGLRNKGTSLELFMQASHLPQPLERFYCEVLFSAVLNNGALLLRQQTGTVKVTLDYQPSLNKLDLYHQTLGADIHFNQNEKSLLFKQQTLESRISSANAVASEVFKRECDRLFSKDIQRGNITDRVQQEMIQSGAEFPSCGVMAKKLHMSESTLQRRLNAEGAKYQTILDQVRYRLAQEYLKGSVLPVTEVAYLLGFSDAANFRRSFKRWSNTTPSKVRQQSARY